MSGFPSAISHRQSVDQAFCLAAKSTAAPRRRKEDGALDWSSDAGDAAGRPPLRRMR